MDAFGFVNTVTTTFFITTLLLQEINELLVKFNDSFILEN
jgi:hypothetical protein